jgi:hypothetical protein
MTKINPYVSRLPGSPKAGQLFECIDNQAVMYRQKFSRDEFRVEAGYVLSRGDKVMYLFSDEEIFADKIWHLGRQQIGWIYWARDLDAGARSLGWIPTMFKFLCEPG